jgi:UDP-N-acetylmuramoylalanine--D-glutamate ligase
VTGSDGKSTTATLASMLLGQKYKTELVGNIGQPMLSSLNSEAEYFVCELSSFMLTYSAPKSMRGAVTNITPNHLDWHKSFEEYKNVKLSLLRNAEEAVISFDDDILREYAASTEVFGVCAMNTPYSDLKRLVGAKVYVTFEKNCVFINGEPIINRDEICRREAHDVKNLMTAIAMTYGVVSALDIRSVTKNFKGLPHRCELIASICGVDYYNSSIDSTPSRSVQTLISLDRKCVIILGGRGKVTSYKELYPALCKYAACAVITGENADDIYGDIKGACRTVMVDNFDDAVEFAMELGRSVGCVLLSPASTSYDAFENFEARGERFNFLIKNR